MGGEAPASPGPPADAALAWTLGMRPSTQRRAATALLRIGRETGSVLDMDALGQRLGTILLETLKSEAGAFLSRRDAGGLLVHWGAGHWARQVGKPLTPQAGPVAHALATSDPALVSDTRAVPAFAEEPFAGGAALLVPLRGKTETAGLLVLERPRPGGFTTEDLRLVQAIAPFIGLMAGVAALHRQTAEAAVRDALTGLYNYRYFSQRLEEEIARSKRSRAPFTLVVLDVDGLKGINDTHGHLAGDAVLRAVGAVLRRSLRASDVVARYGGDEFALVLPETGREGAEAVMGRVMGALQGRPVPVPSPGRSLPPPGVSWGQATYPGDGESATALFAAADRALYQHKRSKAGQA